MPCQRVWCPAACRHLMLVVFGLQLPCRRLLLLLLLAAALLAEELRQRLLRFLVEAAHTPGTGRSSMILAGDLNHEHIVHICCRQAPGFGAAAVEPGDHGPAIHRRHQQAEPAAPGHLQNMYPTCGEVHSGDVACGI